MVHRVRRVRIDSPTVRQLDSPTLLHKIENKMKIKYMLMLFE